MLVMIQSPSIPKSRIDRVFAYQTNLKSSYECLEVRANQAVAVNQQIRAENQSIRAEARILLDWFRNNRAILAGNQPGSDG